MIISKEKPPIYETLRTTFGVDWNRGLVVAYAPNIHTRSGTLSEDLLAHESVHVLRQEAHPKGVEGWWEDFVKDPKFRLVEEILAYSTQVKYIRDNMGPRQLRRRLFKHIVSSLVRMYGGMITEEKAKEMLHI